MSDEADWWDSTVTNGTWRENTEGNPPYNVDAVADYIIDTLGTTGPFLDLGCGTGRLTRAVASRMDSQIIDGVDSSFRLLHVAIDTPHPRIDYHLCDGRTIPTTGPYRGAYAVTVFQHIPDYAKWGYIRQVYDRLLPEGVFLFTLAVGDEPASFLNHQVSDALEFNDNLITLFDATSISEPDENGWTWVAALKE